MGKGKVMQVTSDTVCSYELAELVLTCVFSWYRAVFGIQYENNADNTLIF